MEQNVLMKNLPFLAVAFVLVVGLGFIAILNQQRMADVRMKYREIVDVFAIAERIEGLDMTKFEADIDSETISTKVDESLVDGNRLMPRPSTPSFFINDVAFPLTNSQEEFVQLLEEEVLARLEENPDESIVIKEFFDFNCPFCRSILPFTVEMKSRLPEVVDYRKMVYPFLQTSSRTYALAYLSAVEQGFGDEFILGFLAVNR